MEPELEEEIYDELHYRVLRLVRTVSRTYEVDQRTVAEILQKVVDEEI